MSNSPRTSNASSDAVNPGNAWQIANSIIYNGESLRRVMFNGVYNILSKGKEVEDLQKATSTIAQSEQIANFTADALSDYRRLAVRMEQSLTFQRQSFNTATRLISQKTKQLSRIEAHNDAGMNVIGDKIRTLLHDIRQDIARVFDIPAEMLLPANIEQFRLYSENPHHPIVSPHIFSTDHADIRAILSIARSGSPGEFDKSVVEQKLREQATQLYQQARRIEQHESTISAKDNHIAELEEDRETKLGEYARTEIKHSEEKTELEKKIAALEERTRQLTNHLNEAKGQAEESRSRYETLNGELSALRNVEINTGVENRVKELMKLLKDDRNEQKQTAVDVIEQVRSQEKDIERMKVRERQAEVAQRNAENALAEARGELADADAKIGELVGKINDLEDLEVYEEGVNEGRSSAKEDLEQARQQVRDVEANNVELRTNASNATFVLGDWLSALLDTVMLKQDFLSINKNNTLLETLLDSRGCDLKLCDLCDSTVQKSRSARVADSYVDYEQDLRSECVAVVRLLHMVLGRKFTPVHSIAVLQWLEKEVLTTVTRRQSRSKVKVLLMYVYLVDFIKENHGVEFAMACSVMANLCAQFPVDEQRPGLTASLIVRALDSQRDHSSGDRLSRLCVIRLALSIMDIEVQDMIIERAGCDGSNVRACGLKWDSSLPDMVQALWSDQPKQVTTTSSVGPSGDWAFTGQALNHYGTGVELCIFRNLEHSTTLTLVKGHETNLLDQAPTWVGSTSKLRLEFDEREKQDEFEKWVVQFGPDRSRDVFYWEWSVSDEQTLLNQYVSETLEDDRNDLLAKKIDQLMEKARADLDEDTPMSDDD